MGKIAKTASEKHETTLSPFVSDFVKKATTIPLHELPSHLRSFPPRWPFLRGDVYHWISALNRFDDIFERFISTYALSDGPQTRSFTRELLQRGDPVNGENAPPWTSDGVLNGLAFSSEGDRELVEELVFFSRRIIENCSNRSLYASSSRLSDLLNTTSASLLETTLRLCLRLAQRYSASRLRMNGPHLQSVHQSLLMQHFMVDLERLEQIAQPFAKTTPASRDQDLLAAVRADGPDNSEWQDYGKISFELAVSTSQEVKKLTQDMAPNPEPFTPATPTPLRRSQSANTPRNRSLPVFGDVEVEQSEIKPDVLEITQEKVQNTALPVLLAEYLPKVPKPLQYHFLQRLRVAKAVPESLESRRNMVSIRILAVASLANIYPEQQLQQKVLQQDVEAPRHFQLPHQLCDILHPPGNRATGINKNVQSDALKALEAFLYHKNKSSDVCAELGVSVSHGVLSYVMRKAVAEAASDDTTESELVDLEWRDSLFSLIATLPRVNTRSMDIFMSSGLIDMIVEELGYRTIKAEYDAARLLHFLDSFVYSYTSGNGFTTLVNASGLDVVSALLAHEVNTALSAAQEGRGMPDEYKTATTDYRIPFFNQQTLRALVRFLNHLMSFSGAPFDRVLRNLIESSALLQGIRTIMIHPTIFGSFIWSGAVTLFSSFIHNEPTSYAAIAEAGLTKAFLETITQVPVDRERSGPNEWFDNIAVEDSASNSSDVIVKLTEWEERISRGILSNAECIAALPQAFSAICLNESGMQQFESSSALKVFYIALWSGPHIKALSTASGTEVESLGRDMDELARHHPRLKARIVELTISMVGYYAKTASQPHAIETSGPRIHYKDTTGQTLVNDGTVLQEQHTISGAHPSTTATVQSGSGSQAAPSEDVEMTGTEPQSAVGSGNSTSLIVPQDTRTTRRATIAEMVTVCSRFLAGFFGNASMCAAFAEADGIERLLDLAYAPSLPWDFHAHVPPRRILRTVHTLIETKPHLALPSILRRMQDALRDMQPLVDCGPDSSFFSPFVLSGKEDVDEIRRNGSGRAAECLRDLIVVQTSCLLLAITYGSHNSRTSTNLYTSVNLTDMYVQSIPLLGHIQRKCVWDAALLRTEKWSAIQPATTAQTNGTDALTPSTTNGIGSQGPHGSTPAADTSPSVPVNNVHERNWRPVLHLLENTPSAITKFFSSLGKAVVPRRLPSDSYQKSNVRLIGEKIAEALISHIEFCNVRGVDDRVRNSYTEKVTGRLKDVLIDHLKSDTDRPGPQLLTVVVLPFRIKNGLLLLGSLAQSSFQNIETESAERNPNFSEHAAIVNHILQLFAHLVNNHMLLEANQTHALASRSTDRERPDFFAACQFLVEMRAEILDAVLPIWNSSSIPVSEEDAVSTLAMIMQNTLEGVGENGAIKRNDLVPSRVKSGRTVWKMKSKADFDRLVERNYTSDLAREALYRCNDNYIFASEYCAAHTRDPTLARCPPPPEDVDVPTESDQDQGMPALLPHTDSRDESRESPMASPQPSDPYVMQGAMQRDPLRATADSIMRDPPSQPFSSDSTAHSLSTSPHPARNEVTRVRAGDSDDIITIEDLDDKRTKIRSQLMDRCLTFLDRFHGLTFALAELLAGAASKAPNPNEMRQEVSSTLVESLISYQDSEELKSKGKTVAAVAHLLGIVLQEKDFFAAAQEELKDSFVALFGFLTIGQDEKPEEASPWIPQVMLILEHILAEDAQPRQIQWVPPTSDQTNLNQSAVQLPEPFVSQDEKNQLFDYVMDLLPRVGKNVSLANALVRILVTLTRNRQLCQKMTQKRSLQKLFLMVKQLSSNKDNSFQGGVLLILRHIIEDDDTVRQIMRAEIRAAFEKQSPSRPLDTTTYTRNLYHLVLRAPELFVEVTNELLELKEFNRHQSPQILQLKKTTELAGAAPQVASDQNPVTSADAMTTDESTAGIQSTPQAGKSKPWESKISSHDHTDGVIHYLLSELLSYKDVDDKTPQEGEPTPKPDGLSGLSTNTGDVEMKSDDPAVAAPPTTSNGIEAKKSGPVNSDEHIIFIYRTFILQCLTELLHSYTRTKVEFINYSRKVEPTPTTPSKPRSGALNYLLNGLMPSGIIKHPEDIAEKKKSSISSWAISVLVALCSRTSEKEVSRRRDLLELPEDEPDLQLVRRFVLEHALKAFKDAIASSEPAEMKYSRLLSMSDLFDRMLAGKPAEFRRAAAPDDNLVPSQKQIAKIMFEKNFIGALTNAVSEVDLKIPSAGRVVKYILRPLKLLTHTAVELSLTADDSTTPGQTDEDEISSATSVSEVGDDREETPDFYRNSTLGMFEPGREDEPSSSEDDEDEDEDEDEELYGDQYADDMDYDEEEVISDEDMEMEGMEGMGPIEGLTGDVPGMSVELDFDGDDDEHSHDEDDEMDSDDEDDEDNEEDDDDDVEEIEIMEEVTGDDENASLGDDHDEEAEWQDEDGDDIGFPHVGPETGLGAVGNALQRAAGAAGLESEDDEDESEHYDRAGAMDPHAHDVHGVEIDDDQMIDEESGHEEDEEEDDYEDDALIYGGPNYGMEEDDASLPFLMQGLPAPRRFRSQFPHLLRSSDTPAPGRYQRRSGFGSGPANIMPFGPGDEHAGLNPLLDRLREPVTQPITQPADPRVPSWFSTTMGSVGAFGTLPDMGHGQSAELSAALRSLARHPGMPNLEELLNMISNHTHAHGHHHHHPPGVHQIQFSIGHGARHGVRQIIDVHTELPPPPAPADPAAAVTFTSAGTVERWQAEVRMIFGAAYPEKVQRVINSILQLLVPPAIEADLKRKLLEAAERTKKMEEERQRREAEAEAQRKKEEEEREAVKKAEEEAAAAREQAAEQEEPPEAQPEAMEGIETTDVPSAAGEPESDATPRVRTSIRGRQIDITHLGIDLDFLDALPEEMREEVIMGRYQEQRSEAAAAGEEPSAINREFLEALPADIREELVAEEAAHRRRREREEVRRRSQAAGAPVRAEEIDPASFMASLDPILRQTVLADIADADEDTLAALTPDLAAEARALGGHHRRRALDPNRFIAEMDLAGELTGRQGELGQPQKTGDAKATRRPIVQMLDKAGIATLLRLMFVALHGSSRNHLNGILRNACGNHQTRGEVVSGLLSILQDGTADITSMERSFMQLTMRAKQPPPGKTPQSAKRAVSPLEINGRDVSPLIVVGHCLSALIFLTHSISRLPLFFLSEHELFGSARAKAKAKGKGKDTKAGRYPINALLTLLEREVVIENSQVMESLASLLQIVTEPLKTLMRKEREEESHAIAAAIALREFSQRPTDASAAAVQAPATIEGAATVAANPEAPAAASSSATAQSAAQPKTDAQPEEAKKALIPPEIPEEHLRMIVNIFTARECSGKTFRDTLSTMTNLSAVPRARQIFGQELMARARQLGKSIHADLGKLINALQGAQNEMDAQSLALANFSPAGSDQAKLSRILTALDYLFDNKSADNKDISSKESETGAGLLSAMYEDGTFNSLWWQLSAALSATQQAEKYFLNVATILLPLIESLMVVCKSVSPKEAKLQLGKASAPTTPAPEPALRTIFFTFTNRHKKILNDLVRNNPKLMSGTFSVLVKNSGVLEFDNKRNYFNRKLHHRTMDMRTYAHPPLQLNVRRNEVFRDSYRSLFFKKPEEIKYGKLNIRFSGEEGVDAGGVTREWFQVLARQMFNPDYVLFLPVASDRTTFHPNPLSAINDESLPYFNFIGRIIGKALYENRVLDCHFSRAVYKRMLGKAVTMKDMETIDLDYTKSLQWMLDNDITDIITETFSVARDNFGDIEVVDLIPNGRNIPVTEENKHEYVRLVIADRLTGSVEKQLEHFLKGFHDIVPADLIAIFDEGELELLISGMPEVDVDDWKNNTEYHNYNASSPQIQWFWRAVRSFDKEERAKLLQFVTGAGKVPLNGFKELEGMNGFTRFTIHRDYGSKDRLPSSHTCFNQLDLPEYENYEALRKQLYTAMTTGGEYFGFA